MPSKAAHAQEKGAFPLKAIDHKKPRDRKFRKRMEDAERSMASSKDWPSAGKPRGENDAAPKRGFTGRMCKQKKALRWDPR